MVKKSVEKIVEEMAGEITNQLDMEVVDVEYKKEGGNWFLRVFIDKNGGVDLDDCQRVSEELSARLDAEDPIEGHYYLEVSSPGLDRPLKKEEDYIRFQGEHVDITTFAPIEGRKKFSGKLLDLRQGVVIIEEEKGSLEIPLKAIASCRLAVVF
jgi:ribosome maturation factor RimP